MRCEREGEDRPPEEFEFTDKFGWVHKSGRWHTTDGEDIEGGTIPGPLSEPPDADAPGT